MSRERRAGIPASDIPGGAGDNDQHGIAGAGRYAEGGPVITEGDGEFYGNPDGSRIIAHRPDILGRDELGRPVYWRTDAEYHTYSAARELFQRSERLQAHCVTCTCVRADTNSADPDAHGAT